MNGVYLLSGEAQRDLDEIIDGIEIHSPRAALEFEGEIAGLFRHRLIAS